MKIEIRSRYTNEVIYECEAESLRAALEECARLGRNLAGAYLAGADLAGAYLAGADLYGANLAGANLDGAKGAELVIARTRILPEGSIIGYKRVSTPDGDGIVVLHIPARAKRSHAFGRKCRCEFAEVIEAPEGAYTNAHGPRTEYKVGDTVKPDKWDDNWQNECSNGIHFFITRIEAENY